MNEDQEEETMTSETDELVAKAQAQLDEHKKWLSTAILNILPAQGTSLVHRRQALATQADEIRLRVARTDGKLVSVVYEYPDELFTFLRSSAAPEHLRASVAGGHVVDPNQPASTMARVRDEEP